MLVVSAHYDGGNEFFSDQLEVREFLTVTELERVSCSGSCPSLFSRLKEVYLFGCNTLNAEVNASTSPEAVRSLVRSGYSSADAERLARALDETHGDSSRDRMRRIFRDVPVIYGFSALAPLGPTAALRLNRYLETASREEVGSGRASPALLSEFAVNKMTVASGLGDAEPQAVHRREVCQFVDDRRSPAGKLDFIHELTSRHAEVACSSTDRGFLPRARQRRPFAFVRRFAGQDRRRFRRPYRYMLFATMRTSPDSLPHDRSRRRLGWL